MKRLLISPISVAEAYCHIELTPGKAWIDAEKGMCCGLTAYMLYHKLAMPTDFDAIEVSDMVASRLGWDWLDVCSFTAGFDGIELPKDNHIVTTYDVYYHRMGKAAAELTRAVHGEIKERD